MAEDFDKRCMNGQYIHTQKKVSNSLVTQHFKFLLWNSSGQSFQVLLVPPITLETLGIQGYMEVDFVFENLVLQSP